MGLIEKLFSTAAPVPISEGIKARAADRAIAKVAPFHRQINGIGDAVIIETYIDALSSRISKEEVFAFVTHNIHDFSQKGADTRLPHADLAALFDGAGSRYSTNLGALLGEFASDLIEEITFDREYSQEPRKLSELVEAEHKLFKQVWYNRHWNSRLEIEEARVSVVSEAEYDRVKYRADQILDTVWQGALAAAKRAEEELGPDDIGPWTDFEWGMLNGKLSAIRWVLGDDWDMLDT